MTEELILGYARVTKMGDRIRIFSSTDQKIWSLEEELTLLGDFDISWPIGYKHDND